MKVAVIGAGYVGLVTGACLAHIGHSVICADISADKINVLASGELPIKEPGLRELLHEVADRNRIRFTTDIDIAIRESDILMITVGTPLGPGDEADLSQLWSVVSNVTKHGSAEKLLVIKSTVPVGTCDQVHFYMRNHLLSNPLVDVVHNPEFLQQGNAVRTFFEPDRIVVGCQSEKARTIMAELYKDVPSRILFCDRCSSELIKYASNAFLAAKISYINMIADVCEETGANIDVVAEGMGLDRRIGFSFLRAGIGYGGSCFPKDIEAFRSLGQRLGCPLPLLETTQAVNESRSQLLLDKVKSVLGSLEGTRIAILGLTFKPMTDDIREAPSLKISRLLLEHGASVHGYDPFLSRYPVPEVTLHRDVYDAIESSDAIVILTEWEQFRALDWAIVCHKLRTRVIIDGRNMFPWEEMKHISETYELNYISIGRPPISPGRLPTSYS